MTTATEKLGAAEMTLQTLQTLLNATEHMVQESSRLTSGSSSSTAPSP